MVLNRLILAVIICYDSNCLPLKPSSSHLIWCHAEHERGNQSSFSTTSPRQHSQSSIIVCTGKHWPGFQLILPDNAIFTGRHPEEARKLSSVTRSPQTSQKPNKVTTGFHGLEFILVLFIIDYVFDALFPSTGKLNPGQCSGLRSAELRSCAVLSACISAIGPTSRAQPCWEYYSQSSDNNPQLAGQKRTKQPY